MRHSQSHPAPGCPCSCTGQHSASATVLPDGGVRLDIEWGEPYGGRGYDEFRWVGG
jgi:hypothetical protein